MIKTVKMFSANPQDESLNDSDSVCTVSTTCPVVVNV